MHRKNRQRGIILVTSMWIIMLISVMAALLSFRTRLGLKMSAENIDTAETVFLARGILLKTAYDISMRENTGFVSTGSVFFHDNYVPLDPALLGEVQAKVTVLDEERFLNVNSATQETLDLLFSSFDLTDSAASCLLDWIDQDDDDTNNGFGAESQYYLELKDGYQCKNAPLEVPEELILIRDIEEKGEKVKDVITVLGDGKLNINTADENTLAWLGFSSTLIEKMIDYRKGEDLKLKTEDDQYFESPQDIIANLEEFSYIEAEEKSMILAVLDRLKVNSLFFKIKIEITMLRSRRTYSAEALVKSEDKVWEVLSWKEL